MIFSDHLTWVYPAETIASEPSTIHVALTLSQVPCPFCGFLSSFRKFCSSSSLSFHIPLQVWPIICSLTRMAWGSCCCRRQIMGAWLRQDCLLIWCPADCDLNVWRVAGVIIFWLASWPGHSPYDPWLWESKPQGSSSLLSLICMLQERR